MSRGRSCCCRGEYGAAERRQARGTIACCRGPAPIIQITMLSNRPGRANRPGGAHHLLLLALPACPPLPRLPPGLLAKPWAALLATHLGSSLELRHQPRGTGCRERGCDVPIARYVQLKCRQSFCKLCIRQHLECHGGRAMCPQCWGALVDEALGAEAGPQFRVIKLMHHSGASHSYTGSRGQCLCHPVDQ